MQARAIFAILFVCLLAAGGAASLSPVSFPAGAQRVEPGPGVFLVAKPSIDAGPFFRSVVLLLSHDEQGTLGLIVNRVSDVGLEEALPDLKEEEADVALSFGGPVGMDGLLFLFRADRPPNSVARVMRDVYFSGDREVLNRLLERRRSGDLRAFLGHSGWAPGQLANEIRRGDWELVVAKPEQVFDPRPETLWPRLTKAGRVTASLDESRTSAFPPRP